MEQTNTPHTQDLEVEESTDVKVQTIHDANQDAKATAVAEGGDDLPEACKLSLKPTLVVDNTNIDVEVVSEDYVDISRDDVPSKEIDGGTNDQTEPDSSEDTNANACTTEREEIEIYDHMKDEAIDSGACLSEVDQSPNVISKSKVVEANKDAMVILEDCTIIEAANRSDTVDKQRSTPDDESRLSKHSRGQIDDARDSVKETGKEVHDNDSNQNSTIVTDAELTKLVQEDGEVVVLVQTIPVETVATVGNFIVTLDKKDAGKESDQETTAVTLREKEITDSNHEDNEIDLIDCGQESDGTIIEVTEVIDAPIAEQCEQRDNADCIESGKSDVDTVKLVDGKVVVEKSISNEHAGTKTAGDKALTSSGNKEDDITIIVDEKIIIAEDIEPDVATDVSRLDGAHKNTVKDITEYKEDGDTSTRSTAKKRSVIQDIFDDWGVENADEDAQSTSKVHDSVEIELKSLMDETKTDQAVKNKSSLREKVLSTDKEYASDGIRNVVNAIEKNATKQTTENQKKNQSAGQDAVSLNKSGKDSPVSNPVGRPSRNVETRAFNATSQPHVAVTKNRSRHLTSQIASPAEVTEVLKERLREKQKIFADAPRGPDIFFVKKLTQRLSSKLAGGPVNPMPGLLPLSQQTPIAQLTDDCDKRATIRNTTTTTETSKDNNSDNKELLAILEGDADPDWSILKPPTLTEEAKTPSSVEQHSDHSAPPKLDPLVERELALKQLLELPASSSKKTPTRKKKTFRSAPNKASKDAEAKSPLTVQEQKEEKEALDMDVASENAQPNTKVGANPYYSTREQKGGQREQEIEQVGLRMEESRSGRKRKPTEKAREHEQNTIKRQKVYRGKVPISKKQMQENNPTSDDNLTIENHVATSNVPQVDAVINEKATARKAAGKQSGDNADPILSKVDNSPLKQSKQSSLIKKGPQPIAKRNMVVKRLLRQKIPSNKKPVQLKTKLTPSPKKTPPKAVAKSQKRTTDGTSGDAKPKKKIINEIDRLLQDEGVVNLLYDVEQPNKKRLVPITKSRAQVMDLQKVQRELKIRKKLVRNAVLRLRTSTATGVAKVSPRSKRTAIHPTEADRKIGEQIAPSRTPSTAASPTEFILPAKIRNAADASIIIRRHSSSSFSSASGSPRVSVDAPERSELPDDGAIHSLRSKKRRNSQDEKMNNVKRSKKKTVQNADAIVAPVAVTTTSNSVANNAEEKTNVVARPNKKSEVKKVDKTSKQQENNFTFEDNVSSKVTTRSSNGAVTGKVTAKSKRAVKSKVTFARASNLNNPEESSKDEDKLSACLAEAATALSVVNANRSGNVTTTRKSKVNASTAKTLDLDSNKMKTDTQGQFSNKEINVRRHGNLVQLILTPSSSTKIRNALTLQVMQEFKEALSILKRDDECRVVLLTSTGTSFCEGLDLSTLLRTNKEERRSVAQDLACAVKDFIKSLATFNKPIVAGVQGAAIGLGVTMLPLFDLVIASDKATFCTPYGKLGQIAEGAAVFTLSHILGSAITSELLLGGRTLTASEALRAGLVTRVLWPDRFQVELLPSLRAMSDQSSQSMEATKALLRHSLRKKLDAALESETYLLIQHWCSAECQTAIKAYIDGKIQ